MEIGHLSPANREGLEARAFRLLSCPDDEWMHWLDDLDFWKTGWKQQEKAKKEMEKCILLCAICHRIEEQKLKKENKKYE